MALPTGTIYMSNVNAELGRAWNTPINLNDPEVRALAGKPSGAISMNDLRGKSSSFLSGWIIPSVKDSMVGFASNIIGSSGKTTSGGVDLVQLYTYRGAPSSVTMRLLDGPLGYDGTTAILNINNKSIPLSRSAGSTIWDATNQDMELTSGTRYEWSLRKG